MSLLIPALAKITSMTFLDSLLISLIGFMIVFFVLVVLMVMIRLLRFFIEKLENSKKAAQPVAEAQAVVSAPSTPAPPPVNPNMVPAKGSTGEIKLHNVDDKTAAIIMAIVASKMNAPLNELRFLSIKEK